MRRLVCLITMCACVALQAQQTVWLTAVGNNEIAADEVVGAWGQIYNITKPRIDVYLPNRSDTNLMQTDVKTPMLLVCPGGAYEYVSVRNEGKAVAEWATSQGIAVAVLKYRMPNGHSELPLQDAENAMRVLRDSASQWGISKIGVMGFSAGGHLAGSLLTMYDCERVRPDFGVLIYPVLSMVKQTHNKTRNLLLGENHTETERQQWTVLNHVSAQTPPCFIVACSDDKAVPVSNSIDFYQTMLHNGISAQLLLLPKGGHGFGFEREIPEAEWMHRMLVEWIGMQ